MDSTWLYTLLSVFGVSLISLIGIISLAFKGEKLKEVLIYFVSFSAGGLLGDSFIHLLPAVSGKNGFELNVSLYTLSGIIFYFVVEKFIRWRHCHIPVTKEHLHPLSIMVLLGDTIHNFIDGLVIGASYLVNIPVGIATTLAIIFHEIPQEIGDFGSLLHGGFSKSSAIVFNFFSALSAILGAVIILILGSYVDGVTMFLVPFAAGGFIYIASSDLIPELHREVEIKKSALQMIFFVLGVLIMLFLVLLE